MIINHNMNAMNAHRQMGMNTVQSGKAMEKLSSGLRINRAGDDAAGLAISEKMRGQIRGLDQASRNSQDGISMIQTAEGALNETHSILQRMRELAVQASNDTNTTDDRGQLQKEINQLTSEINRIGNTTEFNTQKLLNGNKAGEAVKEEKFTKDQAGEFSIKFKAAPTNGEKYSINGKEYTIDAASTVKDLATLVTEVNKDAALTGKYTITADGADGIKFVQKKVATEKELAVEVSGDIKEVVTTKAGEKSGDVKVAATDGKVNLQVGANENQSMTIDMKDMRANALGITGKGDNFTKNNTVTDGTSDKVAEKALDVTSHANAEKAITAFDKAINAVSDQRSQLGAFQNRLEHTINNLGTSSENLQAAESRVRDVDMAKEMMNFSKNNILAQAAQAMLAQANQQPQGVLQLLR
ncbi:flagellin [Clostridium botulinum]|uniref:Flagellin n=2 Tax=Clostridium botulinum TaxID=1491 RepID=A0A0A1EIE4_CLOBO|nr:flagellin [Clostridium botulinum]AIY29246.1 flagellin [Clostridium botulinum D/C]AIY29248.1 flagellin [Clostridium botulinum D/C]AIY29249.1 flagellin [Clostridium botulinum D/C]AIY29250.1 flagellin [Clostridium botulinum D/C]AIY29251.1 flagellin [Clostridium botulinum D/C]